MTADEPALREGGDRAVVAGEAESHHAASLLLRPRSDDLDPRRLRRGRDLLGVAKGQLADRLDPDRGEKIEPDPGEERGEHLRGAGGKAPRGGGVFLSRPGGERVE